MTDKKFEIDSNKIFIETVTSPNFTQAKQASVKAAARMKSDPKLSHFFKDQSVNNLSGILAFLNQSNPICRKGWKDETHLNTDKNKLSLCPGCKNAYYCNNECRKSDWQRHQPECLLKEYIE